MLFSKVWKRPFFINSARKLVNRRPFWGLIPFFSVFKAFWNPIFEDKKGWKSYFFKNPRRLLEESTRNPVEKLDFLKFIGELLKIPLPKIPVSDPPYSRFWLNSWRIVQKPKSTFWSHFSDFDEKWPFFVIFPLNRLFHPFSLKERGFQKSPFFDKFYFCKDFLNAFFISSLHFLNNSPMI